MTRFREGAGAQPYWGDPSAGPWPEPAFPYSSDGPALDRTHERRRQMQDRGAAMQSLARMLSGRRTFDRAAAIGLAREIEASAGANLTRMFKPGGNWRRNPLTRARVGDDMEVFKHHAIALQWSAGELADQLEKQPSAEDIRAGLAWSPDRGRGSPNRGCWRNESGVLTREVFNAYASLQATCNNCHANFRTDRR